MKCNQSGPGFELVSPCPYPATITITLRAPPDNHWWNSPAVWWSPGAIRWPVTNPGCGSRTRRRPTSPKRPRLGFRRSATICTLLSLAPLLPWPEPTWLLLLVIRWEHHQHDLPQHLIAAIRRVFAELPPALVEKACSQFRIRIEAVIEAEGSYIE